MVFFKKRLLILVPGCLCTPVLLGLRAQDALRSLYSTCLSSVTFTHCSYYLSWLISTPSLIPDRNDGIHHGSRSVPSTLYLSPSKRSDNSLRSYLQVYTHPSGPSSKDTLPASSPRRFRVPVDRSEAFYLYISVYIHIYMLSYTHIYYINFRRRTLLMNTTTKPSSFIFSFLLFFLRCDITTYNNSRASNLLFVLI
jgi:hypothetical protein